MSDTELCNYTIEDGIATITLNRPKALNALNVATAAALHQATQAVCTSDGVRCIVINANGRGFMAGGDLASMAGDFDLADGVLNDILDQIDPTLKLLSEHDAPVLGSVHGVAAGAGLSLVAACDLVIAAKGTRFLLAYGQIGATPDCGASDNLLRIIGERKLNEMMFLGSPLSDDEALNFGLVNRLADGEELAEQTVALATQIASGASKAFGNYKRLAHSARHNSAQAQLDAERKSFAALTKTADFREGVSAFIEKRKATFIGQ
ncbi:MAG: enoyl-CoA hydratase/isomerase family protein [Spongiibacteraceae bacterium]